jgi:hypothetical protein
MKKSRKNGPFMQSLENLLMALIPHLILWTIIIGAFMSEGSWHIFFSKSLPESFGAISCIWVVMGVYGAWHHKRNGAYPGFGYGSSGSDSDEITEINPSTGLPMTDSGCDVGGYYSGQDPDY